MCEVVEEGGEEKRDQISEETGNMQFALFSLCSFIEFFTMIRVPRISSSILGREYHNG